MFWGCFYACVFFSVIPSVSLDVASANILSIMQSGTGMSASKFGAQKVSSLKSRWGQFMLPDYDA